MPILDGRRERPHRRHWWRGTVGAVALILLCAAVLLIRPVNLTVGDWHYEVGEYFGLNITRPQGWSSYESRDKDGYSWNGYFLRVGPWILNVFQDDWAPEHPGQTLGLSLDSSD